VQRAFLRVDDLSELVSGQFGSDRRLVGLDRLTGGSNKGVYRLRLDDDTTVIVYLWAAAESYWPPFETVPDDPFTGGSSADLFASNHAALTAAGVRVPEMLMLDVDAGLAMVEDAGAEHLEALMERDPGAAAGPLAELGEALRRMHTTAGSRYGVLAAITEGDESPQRPTEDVIVDRALCHLDAAAARDRRLADARGRIGEHLLRLRDPVAARRAYALVHGELGPDHVMVTPAGEPVMIDFEGLTYFDVEWEHAWLQMRFGDAYSALRPVELDPARLELYRYAQVLSLIEGPLRIAETDFPERDWMLDLAEWNIGKALSAI